MLSSIEPGKQYLVNSSYDLGIDSVARKFIGETVTVVKQCKSGLFQISKSDGEMMSIPKRNLSPITLD